ncbi:hypothetical protein [Achromobacter sp. GD03932]|uniref:hypothetical protein n=1 Tax=Achromobacter sp. GD03932 TaxID=2975407 RepID=UPI002447459B|nr:hypothetical protein [Achromobacter sp. GD03932]MDH1299717.1 hypothetical protein [Achromobacter sp. GD03932]
MTDQSSAAQAAEQAIKAAIRKAYDDGYNDAKMAPDNCSTYCAERAVRLDSAALLSKLRAPVASAEVMDALNWVDDFIARCNRDDRGSCDSVNVLRRALASAPVGDERAGNVIDAADSYAEKYQGDDRQDIGIDVRNAFMQGAAWASAPVAGEAQIIGYVPPIYLEMRRRGMPVNSKVQHSPSDDATAPLYAAPQASEAVDRSPNLQGSQVDRLAELQGSASEEVRDAEDAARWRWATASDGNADKLCSIVLCHGGYQNKINERADVYRAALSAQPGAQRTGGSDGTR